MSLVQKAISGASWSFLTQFGHQLFAFVVSVVLARLLLPEDFGLIALMTVFIALGRVITDGGFSSSLIRSNNVSQADYSTVFFINMISSLVMYLAMFLFAPVIAKYFEQEELVVLLRVYSIVFVIGSISLIQNVNITKALNFKIHFKLTLPSLLISSLVSILMAYTGFGVWSLIWKEIIYFSLVTIQYWIYGKWSPSLIFDLRILRHHFSFGYKIALSDILNKLNQNVYNLVIGKFFSISQLGYYNRAKTLEQRPTGFVFSSLNKVLYPLLSKVNSGNDRLKSVYRRIISIVAFAVIPVLVFMMMMAREIVVLLLTEKWINSVPILRILMLAALVGFLQKYFFNVAKVKGRSDLVLRLTLVQLGLFFLTLIPMYVYGFYGLLWGIVGVSLIYALFTAWLIGSLIQYKLREQFSDIMGPVVLSMVGAGAIGTLFYFLSGSVNSDLIRLILALIIFFPLYFSLSLLFKLNAWMELRVVLQKKKK